MLAAEATSPGGLGAIGLDGRVLIFQLINFAILMWLLKKVAYKPIMKVLNDRRQRIEESLEQAKLIEETRRQIAVEQAELLFKTRQEAEAISVRARAEANNVVKLAETAAAKRTEQMLSEAEQRINSELERTKAGLKREVMGLVIDATAAVIEEKLDERKDTALIERALKATTKV